jgi:hypothetical protein
MDHWQQQFNQEIEERTVIALQHAKELGLPKDDLHLLCWHSGIDTKLIERSEHGNRS